jgi:hypothetical protein
MNRVRAGYAAVTLLFLAAATISAGGGMSDFDKLFDDAVAGHQDTYRAARDAILALGDTILPALQRRAADPDWRVSLTAEMLSTRLRQGALCDDAARQIEARWVQEQPVKPITGELSAVKRARLVAALGPAVTPCLLEMLLKTREYKDPIQIDAILFSLNNLHDRRATLPLLDLAQNPARDLHERAMALSVVGGLKDERAVEPLIRRVESRDADLREQSAVALGAIGDRRAFEPLSAALSDRQNSVPLRRDAAYALGLLGDERARAPLVRAMEAGEDEKLVLAAVDALGKTGDSSTLEPLRRTAQKYGTGLVHRAALRAVEAIERRGRRATPGK